MAATRERFERRIMKLKEEITECEVEVGHASSSKVEVKLTMSQVTMGVTTVYGCTLEQSVEFYFGSFKLIHTMH